MEPQIAHHEETDQPTEDHLEWFPWCLPCEAQTDLPAGDVNESAHAQRVWAAYVRQVGAVADTLSQAGCHWGLLKGVAFAATAYPEPWLRTCGDIDVLVATDELELAHEALIQQGFQQDQEYDIQALARKVRAGRARLQHLPPYFRLTGDSIGQR